MAQYKVPQDVEADDKLLGPFTFRQFVYLMITGGCIGVAFALFQIFPLLALIALPFIVFFGALALPLKKDQPMETYFAAIISYHLKPKNRLWMPGQRESTILITAPKKIEQPRARSITEEEAGNRLSFLANVIDTEGYAIRGEISNTPIRAEYIAEANAQADMLDSYSSPVLNQMIVNEQAARKATLMNQMRTAINNTNSISQSPVVSSTQPISPVSPVQPVFQPSVPPTPSVVEPIAPPPPSGPIQPAVLTMSTSGQTNTQVYSATAAIQQVTNKPVGEMTFSSSNISQKNPFTATTGPMPTMTPSLNLGIQQQLTNLANNPDYSIQTIQQQADRLNNQQGPSL